MPFVFAKELEQKLSRQDEATGVAMVMQTQLAKYRELEKENVKLNEDNHYYRYNKGYQCVSFCEILILQSSDKLLDFTVMIVSSTVSLLCSRNNGTEKLFCH